MIFIVSFISNGFELQSVNHTSINENSELKVFKNTAFTGEISNCPNDLLGTNVYKTPESYW